MACYLTWYHLNSKKNIRSNGKKKNVITVDRCDNKSNKNDTMSEREERHFPIPNIHSQYDCVNWRPILKLSLEADDYQLMRIT